MLADPSLLIVDDEESICQGCRRIFARQGFRVDVSSRSPEGLSLAEENEYSAIVLDINMPNLDGLAFLKELRRTRPNVPVVFITGYPSLNKATSAVRLGASDFVTKPFTPQDITEAVERSIRAQEEASQAETSEADDEVEKSVMPGLSAWRTEKQGGYRFLGETWLLEGADQTYRMGTVLPRLKKHQDATIRLPKVGDAVYEGLPWAVIEADGASRTLCSAVTGTVVEVNQKLRDGLGPIWDDACGDGWIVRVSPSSVVGVDLERTTVARNVTVLGQEGENVGETAAQLTSLGCHVSLLSEPEALLEDTEAQNCELLLVDADSFGPAGPELVEYLADSLPKTKVLVMASSDSKLEAEYRQRRIFYYAVEPIDKFELAEVLDAAYCPPVKVLAEKAHEKGDSLAGIRIRNRLGHQVRLLVEEGLLEKDFGLGKRIREKLLARLLPVETMVGTGNVAQLTILEAAKNYDHVLILAARDRDRPVGSLTCESKDDLVHLADSEASGRVTTVTIQPVAEDEPLKGLPESIIEALAENIVIAMVDG